MLLFSLCVIMAALIYISTVISYISGTPIPVVGYIPVRTGQQQAVGGTLTVSSNEMRHTTDRLQQYYVVKVLMVLLL